MTLGARSAFAARTLWRLRIHTTSLTARHSHTLSLTHTHTHTHTYTPADYSRMFMRMACAYLEGRDVFEQDGLERPSGALIDPRVRAHAIPLNPPSPSPKHVCHVMWCVAICSRCAMPSACFGPLKKEISYRPKPFNPSKHLSHLHPSPSPNASPMAGSPPRSTPTHESAWFSNSLCDAARPGDLNT